MGARSGCSPWGMSSAGRRAGRPRIIFVTSPKRWPTAKARPIIPSGLSADRYCCPPAPGERSDPFWHSHEFVPGLTTGIDNGFVAWPDLPAGKTGGRTASLPSLRLRHLLDGVADAGV